MITEGDAYVCLAYRECPAEPVPVLVTDCDSIDQTAPSVIRETFCVTVRKGTPPVLPALLEDELCDALNEKDAEARRRKICEVLWSRTCSTVEGQPCIALAGVSFTDGKITVKGCGARPLVYSNPELFEMLMCLAEQGGEGAPGPKGDPGSKWFSGSSDPSNTTPTGAVDGDYYLNTVSGDVFRVTSVTTGLSWNKEGNIKGNDGRDGSDGIGLEPDLPKILDIAWMHDREYKIGDFLKPVLDVFNDSDTGMVDNEKVIQKVMDGREIPTLTIYFNKKNDRNYT